MKRALLCGVGPEYAGTDFPAVPLAVNFSRLSGKLSSDWKSLDVLLQKATKEIITDTFKTIINNSLETSDIFLFYFCGHGYKLNSRFYLVNYNEDLFSDDNNFRSQSQVQEALISNLDYNNLIKESLNKNPNLTIISILDCCFAGGIVKDLTHNNARHIVLGAVDLAAESNIDLEGGSIFNKSLCDAIRQSSTYNQLKNNIQNNLLKIQIPYFDIDNSLLNNPLNF